MATETANPKTMPFSKRFKLKLFFLFHNLLLFKDIGPYLGTALLLLQLIQSLVLTFNGKNKYLGSYFFGYIIKDIDVIQLYPLVDRYFDTNARIVMNVFLLAFVVAITVSLIIMANRKDYTQNVGLQNFAYLLGYFYEFTTKLLFVPIFGTFIITLKCEEGTVQCFSGQHIILLATSVVGILLLLIVSYIIDAFFFDFSFKSKDSLAHAPVSDFVLNFIYKAVAVILTVGVFDLEYSSLVALYHIVFNAFFLFNSIKKVTYFDIKVHVMNLIASATLAWTNASLVVVDLVEFELLRNNTIFIIIAGSVFFVSLCRNIREKTQDNLLTKEAGELESDILLDSKVRFFFKLARSARNDSQSDLLLASLIKIHIDHCADVKCPCKSRPTLYDPKRHVFGEMKQMPHKDQTFIKHFIYNMLRNGSIKFFNSELLFLDSVFFLFEAMRNYPQAYHLIHLYEKKNMSNNPRMAMQFIIYRLYAKMQDYSMNRNMKVNTTILPYEKVIEFDEEFATLKTMVFSQIEHYINVWEMIDSEFPDLNILNKLLDKTYNHKEKVIKQYEKTLKVNDQSATMMVLMNTYARFVAYDDELAARVDLDIEPRMPMDNHSDNFNFSRDMGRWNIFDADCYTIEIANQMDRLGQITNFSKNALGLLGYQDQELRFQNVKILIPRVIALQHDRILKDFFMNGQDSGLRQPMHNFSINSRGYCFSCHLIIKAIPMHGHYRLMALFRKLNSYDYLITDEKGCIDAFGEKIGQLLELTPQTIQQSRLNLALIAPKTIKYFHYYLVKKEKGLMENSLNKTRSFYIFIPNNWKSLLQRWQEKRKGKNAISIPSLNSGGQENDDISDIDEYYHNMLDYMMKDSKPNYKKIVKVKAVIEHITLRNGEIQMKSLKIVSFKEKNINEVSQEKIKKQHAFIPILAKKISKLLDQKKKEMAHQLELARLKAEENEAAEKAAEDEENAEAGIEAPVKKEQKDTKKPKGVWGNIVDKAKKRGSKKSEKSFEALMHADSDNSDKGLNDDKDDESLDGMSGDANTPKTDSKVGSQISRTGTEKTLMKKPSILKKKSMKEDSSSDRKLSPLERLKKSVRVKIIEETKKKKKNVVIDERFEVDGSPISPVKEKKEKKEKDASKKIDKQLAYVSLLTEDSSSYDGYDLGDKEDLKSMESNEVVNKERKQMFKELAEQGVKEARDMLEKKDIGPSSVASSASYQAKDFSLKLKGLLKAEYVPASLRMSNKTEVLLTLTVLVLVNILSALTRSQVSEWINSIETMNTPNLYEVYLFKTMDSYLTLDLRSNNVLDSTLYDTTWFDKDQVEREEMYTKIRLLKKLQIEDAGIEEDLYSLYFTSSNYNYITKGTAEQRSRDFSGYLNLFMNAINMTLNYDISKYQNIEDDEFLYILNNNFFITLDFLSQQKAALKSNIANTLDITRSLITAEQASGISIIFCSMLIIIPMFLLHNLHLEEVLVLFTNVSKRDSDVYYRHYRTIRLTWNANYEDPYNLQKEVLEEAKLEDMNKKRSKLSTNSKSRPFIPLKKDYKKFIIILGASLLFYAALASVKAAAIRTSLTQIQEYLEDFEDLSEEASSVFKILHNYKLLLNTAVKGGIPTAQELADYSTRLGELDQYGDSSLSVDDQKTVGISTTNIEHLQSISVSNVCNLLSTGDQAECAGLFKGVLQRGFLVIRSDLHAFTKNYFARFTEVLNSSPADLVDLSKTFLNDEDLKDFLTAWTFIQEVIFDWLNASYADMQSKENEMISLYNLFLGLICFSLVLNLATWRYSYQQLVQTLFKFHRYFEILPLELIQNNRSMRSYFERYFRLKEKR